MRLIVLSVLVLVASVAGGKRRPHHGNNNRGHTAVGDANVNNWLRLTAGTPERRSNYDKIGRTRTRQRPTGRQTDHGASPSADLRFTTTYDMESSVRQMSDWFRGVAETTRNSWSDTFRGIRGRNLNQNDWTWNWFNDMRTRPRGEKQSQQQQQPQSSNYYRPSAESTQPRWTLQSSNRGQMGGIGNTYWNRDWQTYPWQQWQRPSRLGGILLSGGPFSVGRKPWNTGNGGSMTGNTRLDAATPWTSGGGGGGRRIGGDSWSWSTSRIIPRPIVPRPNFDVFRNNFFQHIHRPHHGPKQHVSHHQNNRPHPNSHGEPAADGPSYKTLCRGRHYSARRYNTTVWVSAAVSNGSSLEAFRRIKAYFMGENDRGVSLEMDRPLRMTVSSINGTISDTEDTIEDFVLSAMISAQLQNNPPRPVDTMLNITFEPSQVFYATHFRLSRRPGSPAIYDEFFELQDALESSSESFFPGIFHTAFYETWSDVISGLVAKPRAGEILIPGSLGEVEPTCATHESVERGPQNGIRQCGESKCPEYEHLGQLRKDIEIRRVRGASYITRTAPACSRLLPALTAHCALRRYLSGANEDSRIYPSSAPYFQYVYPSRKASSFCRQTTTSAFLLPPNQTAEVPTDRTLRIRSLPDREVYVMKFGGRPTPRIVEQKVGELSRFLRHEGHCFAKDRYVVAVYDHPFNRPPHLNEVMMFRRSDGCRMTGGNDDIMGEVDDETIELTSSRTDLTTAKTATTRLITDQVTNERTTRRPTRGTTSRPGEATEFPPLVELPLALETNSVESWDADLIPYRFSGNETDFPEDFPTDVFVY